MSCNGNTDARGRSRARVSLVSLSLVSAAIVSACAGPVSRDQKASADWRPLIFDHCCVVRVPKNLLQVPQRGGASNPTFIEFGRPGLNIVFEFTPQAGFPEAQSTQTGWLRSKISVDGRRADIVSYDAPDPEFRGGKQLHLRIPVPEKETFQSAPAPEKGMQLGATANCRTEADCEIARTVFRLVDFPPYRGENRY